MPVKTCSTQYNDTTPCLKKGSHLLTVCNFVKSLPISKILHGWKAYEICYKTHVTLPTPP